MAETSEDGMIKDLIERVRNVLSSFQIVLGQDSDRLEHVDDSNVDVAVWTAKTERYDFTLIDVVVQSTNGRKPIEELKRRKVQLYSEDRQTPPVSFIERPGQGLRASFKLDKRKEGREVFAIELVEVP